jgi:GntR family transcriptional regulator
MSSTDPLCDRPDLDQPDGDRPGAGPPAREAAREAYRRQRQQAATSRRVSRATYAQLRAGIRDGSIAPEQRLHESDLVATFAANRNAIRRALQMLAQDGLIERHTRTGTLVTSSIVTFSATGVLPVDGVGQLRVEELDQEVIPMPAALAARMGSDSAQVLAYSQLGVLGGLPLYVRSGYAPRLAADPHFFDQVAESDRDLPPMEVAFRRLFGAELGAVEGAVEWAPAEPSLSRLLGVRRGSPLLVREMLLADEEGRGREYSVTYFRGDRVSLSYERHWPAAGPAGTRATAC